MSALGMHPKFTDQDGYRRWKQQWRAIYKELSREVRRRKRGLKRIQRTGNPPGRMMRELADHRVMASKMNTLMKDAKLRWQRICQMHEQIEAQMQTFPLIVEDAKTVDFHFNRGSIEFPFLPPWTIKAKGQSWYVHHVDFSCTGTTRETPDHPSTKGAIRFRKVSLIFDQSGVVTVTDKYRHDDTTLPQLAGYPE